MIDGISITVNSARKAVFEAMPNDPGAVFGNLVGRCISDIYLDDKKHAISEGVVFLALGAICSAITTYALTIVGTLL